jgi:hypothetical protein
MHAVRPRNVAGTVVAFVLMQSAQIPGHPVVAFLYMQLLPRDLSLTAAFDIKRAKMVWMPEEPKKDVLLPAAKNKPAHPLPSVPKQQQRPRKVSSHPYKCWCMISYVIAVRWCSTLRVGAGEGG